ncbi:MAG: WYL domain-containing protein [Desulfobacterota bacterium]|nr:WYL domain-containing protein [Thermodesulfobacteriota bacterium]
MIQNMRSEGLKRTYRLIRLIQDIKSSPYQSVEQLLRSHGISKAQFYKDKNDLKKLGFEFFYHRGKSRFIITKDAYLPIENLTISERLSLLMAVRQLSASGDYILSYEGLNAARKLSADLPSPLRENALTLFDTLVIKEGFGCRREVMEKLQTAVAENRRVVIRYQAPDLDKPSDIELDPYHLFFQRRALYVEGFSWKDRAIRMYRLNRILSVGFTPMCFTVPEDYNFSARYKNAFSVFPGEQSHKVCVLFSKRARPYIEESLWHNSQKITRNNDGSITFEVRVAEPREVMWWAFQWGAEAEIIEPIWLREEAKKAVAGMAEQYGTV